MINVWSSFERLLFFGKLWRITINDYISTPTEHLGTQLASRKGAMLAKPQEQKSLITYYRKQMPTSTNILYILYTL